MQPKRKSLQKCVQCYNQPVGQLTLKKGREGERKEGGRKREKEKAKRKQKKKKKRTKKKKALVKVKFANFCGVTAPTMMDSSHQDDVIECELGKRHDNWLYYYVYYCVICC